MRLASLNSLLNVKNSNYWNHIYDCNTSVEFASHVQSTAVSHFDDCIASGLQSLPKVPDTVASIQLAAKFTFISVPHSSEYQTFEVILFHSFNR
jgi:ABC-type uncharacterized transport system substrate-binding protein